MNNQKNSETSWKSFLAFFRHAQISWGWILIALILNIVYYQTVTKLPGSTAGLFTGRFTKAAIMGVVTNYSLVLIWMSVVMIAQVFAIAKSVKSVRRAVWTRMMGVTTSYYDKHGPNTLFSAVTSDVEIAITTLVSVVVSVPGMLSYLIKAIPMIGGFSPKLLWAVWILIPIYIIYAFGMGSWQMRVGNSIQMKIGGLTGYLTDRIRNLTMIKTFVTEDLEEQKGVSAAKELYKTNIEYSHLNAVIVAYTIGTEVAGIVCAVLWGCNLLRTGEINLEQWLAFFLFVPTINTVFRQFTMIWANFKEVQGRATRLGVLMEAPQEEQKECLSKEIPNGDIRFEHVTFAYTDDTKLYENLSFVIPQGKTTAIIGYSGCGKTTILKLLERLYSPQNGKITIGDTDIEKLDLKEYRNTISYVNQEAGLFSGTIREALLYGNTNTITVEKMDEVTKLSGIYEFIQSQPDGYDTELAIWGSAMSGGQRQRMVIARELLKNTEILLLDEPTSALDAETASSVSETFYTLFKGKTIVTVTHEIGFVVNADQIIVIRNGQIDGIGTHEELYRTNSMYQELFDEQSIKEVLG
ncbi:MAG: ABC transporter ATP-binding protein [Erysipelotrichaceae bacterium]|nr:ABC transporter ATP-binding protein [Erysipelotrichaceae bacterium]